MGCQDFGFEGRSSGFYFRFEKIISNLGTTQPEDCSNLEAYTREMEEEVIRKVEKLEAMGWEAYPG
jgi:hypothetical protein